MPAIWSRQGGATQATDSICSDVSTSVKRLVVIQLCASLPSCFSARGSHAVTYALLEMGSVIGDSHEDFNVSADCLDAMQRLCHGALEGELCNASWDKLLCSNTYWDAS